MKQRKGHRWIVVMLAVAGLLAGCSDDMPDTSAEANEIRFRADVWRVMEGTRATTFDNAAALQSEGSFTATVYTENTTTQYVSTTAVDWNGSTSKWEFASGKHYWPMSGALDFFAYMPAAGSLPAYITSGPTYTADHDVSFSCTSLPMTADTQSGIKEFVYAIQPGQNKASQGASGVTLTFAHPFARIILKWANYDHSTITLNSVTLKGLKNNGGYDTDDDPVWTTSGDNTNFVTTALDAHNASPATPYLVIPQEFSGEIEVSATWNEWDVPVTHVLSTTLSSVTWEPGYSYTYTFTVTINDLKVNVEKFTEQW